MDYDLTILLVALFYFLHIERMISFVVNFPFALYAFDLVVFSCFIDHHPFTIQFFPVFSYETCFQFLQLSSEVFYLKESLLHLVKV